MPSLLHSYKLAMAVVNRCCHRIRTQAFVIEKCCVWENWFSSSPAALPTLIRNTTTHRYTHGHTNTHARYCFILFRQSCRRCARFSLKFNLAAYGVCFNKNAASSRQRSARKTPVRDTRYKTRRATHIRAYIKERENKIAC